MEWKVRGIRGATTVPENTVTALAEAVNELLDEIEVHNKFQAEDIVCVFFYYHCRPRSGISCRCC